MKVAVAYLEVGLISPTFAEETEKYHEMPQDELPSACV
jgi:hypothetical protein